MQKIPHKWRELSLIKKLAIPINYFHLNIKEIEKIRKIPDIKKRLIESAKLQYEIFKDIHTDLTAWIAGYSSDSKIREVFGTSRNLREIFIKNKIHIKGIEPSWPDIKRNIRLPEKMNNNLAEETGIHIGDGNLYGNQNSGMQQYRYSISGDLTNDYLFHKEHIANLISKIYNCMGYFVIRENKNNIDSVYKSKAIFQFKNKILNLPIGKKTIIKIPRQIFESEDFEKRCIVGIIDTDFSLTNSMTITGKIMSIGLVKQICGILKENHLKYKCTIYHNYGRFYISRQGTKEIIEDWKLRNLKHLSKYYFYNEYKKALPFTTTCERLAVLDGKLSFEEIQGISKKRCLGKSVGSPTHPVKFIA